jgi:CDGSH-type Zn-finger protein
MARLVKHEAQSPFIVKEGQAKFPIAVCACGLSKKKPFCDGSHRKTRDEEAGETYIYDDSERVKVQKEY